MSVPTASPVGKTRLQESLERAKRGEGPSVGQWLEFPGYSLARTVAALGEDWVLIDMEHGAITDHDMYLQVGAVASAGASPIVRVAGSEPWMLKRALDCGAHAVMVPMVETAAQAEAVARACKYPSPVPGSRWAPTTTTTPRTAPGEEQTSSSGSGSGSGSGGGGGGGGGLRGAGAMFAHAAFGPETTGRDYYLAANERVLVCVQIESRLAVANAAAIAAVEGVDMLFVGPNDLAASMGAVALDHARAPDVQAAIAGVLAAGLAAGKYVGHFALDAEEAARRYAQGFHFVNCGADIVALTAWMAGEMARMRALVAEGGPRGGLSR